MTATEFSKLPESSTPMELIDGILTVWPHPTPRHQLAASRLIYPLVEIERRAKSGLWISSPVDLFISPNNVFQPDGTFFSTEHRPDMDRLPVTEVPGIVVEVTSPATRSNDKVRKRSAYFDRGVPEYWIVDPAEGRISFHIAIDDDSFPTYELNGAIIPVGRYSGVELDLDWIFAR